MTATGTKPAPTDLPSTPSPHHGAPAMNCRMATPGSEAPRVGPRVEPSIRLPGGALNAIGGALIAVGACLALAALSSVGVVSWTVLGSGLVMLGAGVRMVSR